ncbi:hypothetical protein N9V96_03655, partial [Polaribacter sp.]|nr:hypothetical protein [Polaribacter sp.]
MRKALFITTFLIAQFSFCQLVESIGKSDFSDWDGISKIKKNRAFVNKGDTISYTYKNQNRVYFPGIKRPFIGDAADWTKYKGLLLEVYVNANTPTKISAIIKVDTLDYSELNPISKANITLTGKGWHAVYIPWDLFDVDLGQSRGMFFAVKHLLLTTEAKSGVQIKNVKVTKGLHISLEAEVQGKSSDVATAVVYEFEVGNTSDKKQSVALSVEREGWESMSVELSKNSITLNPLQVKKVQLTVTIPAFVPKGIREKQIVKAIANGYGASKVNLEFITAVKIPSPNIVFTEEGWQKIIEKAAQYDWAQKGLQKYIEKAEAFKVPKAKDSGVLGKSVFTTNGAKIYDCAIAYQLTGNENYATKCLQVLRPLTDDKTGYPATLVGGGNSFVAEGKFWQAVGRTYDLVRNSPQVTTADKLAIEKTLRLFVNQTLKGNVKGAISNWNVAEITAAFYCAMNLQDWHLINQLLESPTGIYKHLENGIMSDGWWYECAVGYNTWVATEFSEIALALEPWGINFKDRTFPIGTSKHFSLLSSRRQGGIMGMEFEKWGKIEKNNVGIKDMWDATVPFLDYRGVILAVNDAVESKVSGKPYELAYYMYRDPEYAAIINRGGSRDLLYGVPDLPKVTSKKMKESVYADNMGIVQLRSQTQNRPIREQIQASLHYGSHGGYHGHFDRTNMVNMARYGRSFYGTLAYWFGYGSYMYKFWMQTSINKNMVVVDEKMQLPVQNSRKLFYSGNMMQATAIETNSKWSYPPYGGIPSPKKSFAQKTWDESRSLFIPEITPHFGEITGETAPVMQRRAMVILDDYVVLADYLEGEKEHQFDWMLQIKGFKGIVADKIKFSKHTNQMSTNPLGSAQFITDCNWYNVEGTSKTQYEMCFGEGCDNQGVRMPNREDGSLKIDVYNAWPKKAEVMVGTSTETISVNKKLWYEVFADGVSQLKDSTGAWIL